MKKDSLDFISIIRFFIPLVYVLLWTGVYFLSIQIFPKEITSDMRFITLYTVVFIFATIVKSTSWSIGHEKFGIKADSRSRVINYHSGKNGEEFWFDLFGDQLDLFKNAEFQKLIKFLVNRKSDSQSL